MTETTPAAVTDGTPGVARTTLCENEWVSLMIVRKPDAGVNGYVFSHETRCQGRIVAVLPYRDVMETRCTCDPDPEGQHQHERCDYGWPMRQYLVKSEMTPCWGFDQVLSAITGGYEGGDIEDDAVREMLEETGYAITRDELIPLGASFASKSADTVYSLFSVNLTGREAGEAIGDGSRLESESEALWVDAVMLATLRDPQLAVMCMRIPSTYELADAAPPVAAALDRDAVAAVLRKQLGTADFQAREVAGQICALMGGGSDAD